MSTLHYCESCGAPSESSYDAEYGGYMCDSCVNQRDEYQIERIEHNSRLKSDVADDATLTHKLLSEHKVDSLGIEDSVAQLLTSILSWGKEQNLSLMDTFMQHPDAEPVKNHDIDVDCSPEHGMSWLKVENQLYWIGDDKKSNALHGVYDAQKHHPYLHNTDILFAADDEAGLFVAYGYEKCVKYPNKIK